MVDGVWGCAVITTDAKGDLLYLFGTANINYLEQFYQKRWTIETVFHAFKSRGFNLEDIVETTNISAETAEEFTEHSQLDICVSATGDCNWKVSNKRGKSPVYSPLSIYVVSCLRQMSGDYGALPEKIVNNMRAQGSSVQGIGNQTIVVKTPPHPTNGQFGMMIMDTSRCAFLGSSLYNSEDRLQFKVIYNYDVNEQTGDRYLASATLITNDFERQTTTETTTFFTKKE